MVRPGSRRGQMEIMGLVIIVILIVIGVLFAIKFIVLKKPTDIRQTYGRSQMASNIGIALLQSSTANCRGTDLTELLTDWAESPNTYGTITCDYGTIGGIYVNNTIFDILNKTLNQWKTRYEIKAYTSTDQLFKFNNLGCADTVPGESDLFFLPTDYGVLTVKIFICSGLA